jgi:signal transduction histidine kinase
VFEADESCIMAINLSQLGPGATLGDLPAHVTEFDDQTLGSRVAAAFQHQPELPGIIIRRRQQRPTVVPRQKFFQELSVQYSREVYLCRPIAISLSARCAEPLRLTASCGINDAVSAALQRAPSAVYDPLLIEWEDGRVGLLDMLVLLQAQSAIFATTHVAMLQNEKLASVGQLAAGIAHEINNPLAFVKNNNAVLQRDINALSRLLALYQRGNPTLAANNPGLNQEIAELAERLDLAYTLPDVCEILHRSAEGLRRIQEIVQNLRDFVRLDQNDFDNIDLNAGIESTVNMIRHRALDRRIQITMHLNPLPKVACYPDRINQVVLNLLSNAIDASPDGADVDVRTAQEANAACVEVIDTGSGIDPKFRDRIFDPFFTTKAVGKGAGMGLSISYGIVSQHGGKIEVESHVGKGSTFRVRLPMSVTPAYRAVSQASESRPDFTAPAAASRRLGE